MLKGVMKGHVEKFEYLFLVPTLWMTVTVLCLPLAFMTGSVFPNHLAAVDNVYMVLSVILGMQWAMFPIHRHVIKYELDMIPKIKAWGYCFIGSLLVLIGVAGMLFFVSWLFFPHLGRWISEDFFVGVYIFFLIKGIKRCKKWVRRK